MNRWCFPLLLTLICSLWSAAANAVEFVDQAGRTVSVPQEIKRVISLAPSITETVYAVGRENLLVGATQFSNSPEAAAKLPRVGSYVRLDLEKILALKPDLCLAIKDGNPLSAVQKIESFGIPVYVIDPRNLEDIIDVVVRFGDLLRAEKRAGERVRDMRSRLAAITKKIAGIDRRPTVFFQIDAAPIISAGSGTFIDELITLAGGRNLAAESESAYPRFGWEDILRLAPEVAMVASMAGGHSVADLKASWAQWPQIPAVRDHRVHVVDANLVDRPTPHLLDGLERFAALIHPELFQVTHE